MTAPARYWPTPKTVQLLSEAKLQAVVVEAARLYGWLVFHPYDSRRSEPGYPDLTLARNGELIFAELKSDTGRVTDAQQEWLTELGTVAGAEVHVWRPADLDAIHARLKPPRYMVKRADA